MAGTARGAEAIREAVGEAGQAKRSQAEQAPFSRLCEGFDKYDPLESLERMLRWYAAQGLPQQGLKQVSFSKTARPTSAT